MIRTRRALVALSLVGFATCFSEICLAQPKAGTAPQPQAEAAVPDNSSSSYDHGPRAGFMRGGGAIQAELLLGPASGFRMYFIDQSWIDLDLTGARIEALLVQQNAPSGSAPQAIACTGKPTPEKPGFFVCELPKTAVFAIGDRVFVKHTDNTGKATTFNYTFPFKAHEPLQDYPAATSGTSAKTADQKGAAVTTAEKK